MSISWENLIKPNFTLEFYLRDICQLNDDDKYNYEEFLDKPKLYSMTFADTYDPEYIEDNINIDAVLLLNKNPRNINNIDISTEQPMNEQMIGESDKEYDEIDDEEYYEDE